MTIAQKSQPQPVSDQPINRQIFDQYWADRDLPVTDARTRQRIEFAAEIMTHAKGTLLDVGCGRGAVAEYFQQKGHQVTGIDVSPRSVEWTKQRGINAEIVDLDNDGIKSVYDTILCLETLQYVRHPVIVLDKLISALNPGGELIISLPCEYHLQRRLSILFSGRGPGGIDFPLTVLFPREHQRLFDHCQVQTKAHVPISVIPPRWRALTGAGQWMAKVSPGLFAISIMYRLTRDDQ